MMEFTFNQNKPAPYPFIRIDRYLYKFSSLNGGAYKFDFKPDDFNSSIIKYENYKTFQLKLSGRFNHFKGIDEKALLTCLHIIRDFLQKKVTAEAILLKQNDLLSDNIFELKGKFDLKKLEILFDEKESIVYLVKEV